MTAAIDSRHVLLVDSANELAESISTQLRSASQTADITLSSVHEQEFVQELKQRCVAGKAPAVVLIGPQVTNLSALVRVLRSESPNSYVVFLQPQDRQEAFRKELRHVPLSGLYWAIVDIEDPDLAQKIDGAAQAVQRRMQLQSTIDRANVQISAARATENIDYRRLVISDHYLMNFLTHAQDAIVAVDLDFRVLYWSAGAERLFERDHRHTIGLHVSDLPFWSQELHRSLSQLHKGVNTLSLEVSCQLARRQVTVDIVLSAVRDEMGGLIGTSLIIRDVSERQRQLEAEREEHTRAARIIDSERRHLRSLFKQAPGFIAVVAGPEHVFELANDAYYQLVGHRSILGKPVREALPEMQGQGFVALLEQVYTTGEPYLGRGLPVRVQRHTGALETLYLDFVYQPIVEADGTVAGVFCQGSDVTEHKLTQDKLALHQEKLEKLVAERTQALEKSQHALQRSQKLEAIGKLTGGVAHDFNNVLQIISGNLQLLQTDLSGPSKTYVNSAVEAVERGAKLSSQLLAFARRQPLQPVAVNLGRVLRDMDDLLRRALGETIEIETVVGGGLWNTMVDPHQLENVILNLSINARDAMPNGGKLTLELGNALLDDQYVIDEPDLPAGQYVMLGISDTGKGMTPEVMERAFDPFFTTKREGEGTGLGLSMAYGFVKQSHGHIRIYSEPGCGTTFRIYLPRTHQPEVEALSDSRNTPVIGGSETILVVEDDLSVQETVVRLLQDLGYKVLKASDAQSALSILQSGFDIDMLFTDVVMPGSIRSPELAKQAKRIFPDIAVLFTSGYTQNAIVHGGRLDPGVELLSKPYRREDLARKIRHVFANAKQAKKAHDSAIGELAQQPQLDAKPMRVLVVEDDADSQAAVCQLLELLEHKPKGVSSAEDALAALNHDEFDLLFTDVNLPGMSGIDLVERAQQRDPELKVIVASGYGSAIRGLQPTAIVLPKPFDLERLRQALASASAE